MKRSLLILAALVLSGCVLAPDYRAQMTPEQLQRWKSAGWASLGAVVGAAAVDDGDTYISNTYIDANDRCGHPSKCER